MDNLSEFFWSVAASSVGTTVLLGAAAFLLRTHISHWLNKDLEALKLKYQQDLESYRVSLIAEAERAKSQQAIKTAKALRIAELQFAALERLQRSLMPHASRASAFIRAPLSPEKFQASFGDLNKAMTEATDAIRSAGLFLPPEDIATLYELEHAYSAAIGAAWHRSGVLTDAEALDLEVDLFRSQRAANEVLRKHVTQMLDMS